MDRARITVAGEQQAQKHNQMVKETECICYTKKQRGISLSVIEHKSFIAHVDKGVLETYFRIQKVNWKQQLKADGCTYCRVSSVVHNSSC